jgi:hypothetical protein
MVSDKILVRVALDLMGQIRAQAVALAGQTGEPESKVLAELLDAINKHKPIAAKAEADKRTVRWRIRLLLYAPSGELVADTDPELPPEAPGTIVVASLPGVAEELHSTIMRHYGGHKLEGVTMPELLHRIRSLRPTLSRRGGAATWRVPFKMDDLPWRVDVDVRKEASDD